MLEYLYLCVPYHTLQAYLSLHEILEQSLLNLLATILIINLNLINCIHKLINIPANGRYCPPFPKQCNAINISFVGDSPYQRLLLFSMDRKDLEENSQIVPYLVEIFLQTHR